MGIILTDVYPLPSGINLSNVYVSFYQEQLFIQPTVGTDNSKQYMVSSNYRVYKDQDARNQVLPVVEKGAIMNTSDTLTDAYSQLYVALKQKFPNCIDT
jgi:hypothetical protein